MMRNNKMTGIDANISDLAGRIQGAILATPEQSIKAIFTAIEDHPETAQRAGISDELINLSCGLDWDRSTREIVDYGVIYALTRLTAIARFLSYESEPSQPIPIRDGVCSSGEPRPCR